MRKTGAFILMVMLGTPATAAGWDCSNRNIAEIRCDAASCDIEKENYTPISASITPGRIEICAYSGCFPGRVLIRRTAGPHVLYNASIRSGSLVESASIVLDTAARTAMLRWGNFSNVMRCTAR